MYKVCELLDWKEGLGILQSTGRVRFALAEDIASGLGKVLLWKRRLSGLSREERSLRWKTAAWLSLVEGTAEMGKQTVGMRQ